MCSIFPLTSDSGAFEPTIESSQELDSPTLYLYYMSQDSEPGFNSMRSCVVCASSQKEAMKINPFPNDPGIWPGAETIRLLGKAFSVKAGEIICTTFNHLLLN